MLNQSKQVRINVLFFNNLKLYLKFLKVVKMETEARENIMKTAPHLLKEVTVQQQAQDNYDSLHPINEAEEEEQDNEEDEYEHRDGPHGDQNDEENERYEDYDEEDEDSFNPKNEQKRQPRDSLNDNDEESGKEHDSNSELEDNIKLQPRVAKKEVSAEDEEFMRQFDSILTENIAVNLILKLKILFKLKSILLKAKNQRSDQNAIDRHCCANASKEIKAC